MELAIMALVALAFWGWFRYLDADQRHKRELIDLAHDLGKRSSAKSAGSAVACSGKVHDLRCWPEPFRSVCSGAKRHEVRKDDRNYQVGDRLHLREWDPAARSYTGREVSVMVTHLTDGGTFGLPPELVVMSVVPV